MPAPGASISEGRAVPDAPAAGSQRIALVIGNADYRRGKLENPANDARAMEMVLTRIGFDVATYVNLTESEMALAIREFGQRLASGGVGLFYFAGHGLRAGDRTLLVPVDVDTDSPKHLLSESVDLGILLRTMSGQRPGAINLAILDMCLDSPFGAVNQISAALPEKTLVAYSTAPGGKSDDGATLGLFTDKLIGALALPAADISEVFERASAAVSRSSGHRQVPWVGSTLSDSLSLGTLHNVEALPVPEAPTAGLSVGMRTRGVMPKDSAEQYELAFWESIKNSSYAKEYEAYLAAYPNGRFAGLARARLERLRGGAPKPAPAAEPAKPASARPAVPERPPRVPAGQQVQDKSAPARPASAAAEPSATKGAAVGTEIRDCPTCPIMIPLRSATFTMGTNNDDPSERPAHPVTISRPFAIGKFEVTVEQWRACVDAGACPAVSTQADAANNTPVRDLSWDDAQQYLKWLSRQTQQTYRFPTEAEWEYAARGGTTTRYWWGDQMQTGKANCKDCGEPWRRDRPANVGSFAANPFGLHDMNGSVWEWVSDCWHSSFKGAPSDGRSWDEDNCRARVIRGGSWRDGATYMLSTTRFKYDASVRVSQNGLRVVRDVR